MTENDVPADYRVIARTTKASQYRTLFDSLKEVIPQVPASNLHSES